MKKFSFALLGMFLYLNDSATARESHEQNRLVKRFAKKEKYQTLLKDNP